MINRIHRSFFAGAFIGASLIAASAAQANVIADSYQGGITPPGYGDVVGVGTVFGINSLDAYRSGPNGNTLNIVISTYYAGVPGTGPAFGTGYGDLFITPGANAWNPVTTGGTCGTNEVDCADVYRPGEWAYVATIPSDASGGAATSGTGNFYSLAGNSQIAGTIGTSSFGTGPGVVTSNDGACEGQNTTTGCNVYRADQAVGYDPTTGQTNANSNKAGTQVSETYSVVSGGAGNLGTITYSIVDYGLLGNNFALSWAMTCANDVVQGQMTVLASEDPVREPPTWAMLLAGLFSMGAYRRWQRTKSQDQSFQFYA
jgi:hypothetical protein